MTDNREKKQTERQQKIRKDRKITRQQLLPGILISVAIGFLLLLYAPVELYCSNLDEFWFDFGVLIRLALGMFAVGTLVLTAVYTVLLWIHPVLYKIGLAGGLILFLCSYVQGEFLITGLPVLDGTALDWNAYPDLRRGSLILWAVVILVTVVLLIVLKNKKQMFENVLMFISGCMTLMLLVTMISTIMTSGMNKPQSQLYVTEKDEFNMSENENFVILVLDTVDSREFASLLEEHPEYREIFQDFTYFENTTGGYACTRNSIPFILSGEWYEEEEPFIDHVNRVYSQSPLFGELEQRGYRLGLYEDQLYTQEESVILRFENVVPGEYKVKSYKGLAIQELKLVGYRYAPFDLKRFCMTRKAGFDEEIQVECEYRGYTADNSVFKSNVEKVNLTTESDRQFKFIHLDGAHTPYVYDKDCNVIDESRGSYRQSVEASITITAEYLEKLKESGVYDNTALIVMADHGYNGPGGEGSMLRQSAMLLIKGRGEHHDTMGTSQAPISYVDLQQAYVRLLDGAESAEVFEWKEGDTRERRFLMDSLGQEEEIVEYVQTGYAQDMTTMVPTGREFTRK